MLLFADNDRGESLPPESLSETCRIIQYCSKNHYESQENARKLGLSMTVIVLQEWVSKYSVTLMKKSEMSSSKNLSFQPWIPV